MMKLKLVSVLFLTRVYRCCGNYEFEMKEAKTIQQAKGFEDWVPIDPLSELTDTQKASICQDAIVHVLKKDILVRKLNLEMKITGFVATLSNGAPMGGLIALKCPCVPTLVLRFTTAKTNSIFILVQQNQFLAQNIIFMEEIVESIQPSEIFRNNRLVIKAFRKFIQSANDSKLEVDPKMLWDMCVIAKKQIQNDVTLAFNDDWREKVGVFDVVQRGKTKTDVPALRCKSAPEMYIGASPLPKFQSDMYVVMLDKREMKEESSSENRSTGESFHSTDPNAFDCNQGN